MGRPSCLISIILLNTLLSPVTVDSATMDVPSCCSSGICTFSSSSTLTCAISSVTIWCAPSPRSAGVMAANRTVRTSLALNTRLRMPFVSLFRMSTRPGMWPFIDSTIFIRFCCSFRTWSLYLAVTSTLRFRNVSSPASVYVQMTSLLPFRRGAARAM